MHRGAGPDLSFASALSPGEGACCNGGMSLAALLTLGLAASPVQDADAPRPAISIHTAKTADAEVFYLSIPWGPNTFAGMERPGEGYYNRRSWPFARLETTTTLTLDGTRIPPGNHALVFHPNTPDDTGMSLEVRRIDVPEFLQEGNAMTRTPDGETVWRAPVRFETVPSTVTTLEIHLVPEGDGFRLDVRYGDRRTSKTFLR